MSADFNSPYYPYEKVYPGYLTGEGSELIPDKLIRYLMDLPDAYGYQPADDNGRPRVKLMKYLWYDGEKPLDQPLPTPQQKISLLYNGESPVVNTDEEKEKHPKGYRLYPMQFWIPADYRAGSLIKCYMGRNLPYSPVQWEIGVVFEIVVNYQQDNNMKTRAMSRLAAMEQALIHALHGVNITGVGGVNFNRIAHMDDGSRYLHDDGTNIARQVNFSITWNESQNREKVIE